MTAVVRKFVAQFCAIICESSQSLLIKTEREGIQCIKYSPRQVWQDSGFKSFSYPFLVFLSCDLIDDLIELGRRAFAAQHGTDDA